MHLRLPEIPLHAQRGRGCNRDDSGFRDFLTPFVLTAHLESVPCAADYPKEMEVGSYSLILLAQAQHQDSKEKGKGKVDRQWGGLCKKGKRERSFPSNSQTTMASPHSLLPCFLAVPVLSHLSYLLQMPQIQNLKHFLKSLSKQSPDSLSVDEYDVHDIKKQPLKGWEVEVKVTMFGRWGS